MKFSKVVFGLFLLLFLWMEAKAQRVDPCRLMGTVYVESNRSFADFTVFVDDGSAAFADLNVVEVDNRLFADKPGLWYFTPTRALADFTIFYEKSPAFADFTIFFETAETFAGCNR